jgi:Zn-finger protein
MQGKTKRATTLSSQRKHAVPSGEDATCGPVGAAPAAFKGFTHRDCEYFPCHPGVRRPFNCLFCYCPLIERECPGPYQVFTGPGGEPRKDCSNCRLPHEGLAPAWHFVQRWLGAPPWRGAPQSRARIRAQAQVLRNSTGEGLS